MVIIEVAVRGRYPEQRDRIIRALIHGLTEQASATPWKLVASLTNNAAQDCGGVVHINKGIKL